MITNDEHDEWTNEVITILEKVRVNSINLSEYHRTRYYYFKGFSKYFDIPVLVLSTLSGSFSVGSQAYLPQSLISVIGCIISMLITIITSIKLYLNIQDNLQVELNMSKEFYTLAIDIYKVLTLPNHLKGEKGLSYLNKKYSLYNKLVEASDLLQKKNKHDQLATINMELMNDYSNSLNSNSEDNIELKKLNKYDLPIVVNTPKNNNIIDPITVYNAAANLNSPKTNIFTNSNKQLYSSNQINNSVNRSINQLNNPLNQLNNPINQLNNPLNQSEIINELLNSKSESITNQLNNQSETLNSNLNNKSESMTNLFNNQSETINNNLNNKSDSINNSINNSINQLEQITSTIGDNESLDNIISLFDNKSSSKSKSKSKSKRK